MTRQAAESASALFSRLTAYFDDTPRTGSVESTAGTAGWPHGWAHDIADVRTLVIHTTDGWPTHDKTQSFVDLYTNPHATPANKRGVGPHFYMTHDGSVARLLSENRQTWHANHVNGWAIGVETGNLTATGHPGEGAGHWPHGWTRLSTEHEDVPGGKLYAMSVNGEILVSTWSTHSNRQSDTHSAGRIMMWISEEQYRSWALLARWLCEVWKIPRNFPLRPHIMRSDTYAGRRFRVLRELVEADPMRDEYLRDKLAPAPYHCNEATYLSDVPATGLPHVYGLGVATSTWTTTDPATGATTTHHKQINNLWTDLFDWYRGIHGHGFSGANSGEDHNCPGAWFDWHRFARQVWDSWWYPFDLAQAGVLEPVTSHQPLRDYGVADGILREHYFDEDAALFAQVTSAGFFPIGEETVAPHLAPAPAGTPPDVAGMMNRYWGFWHGGMHFELGAGSPLYALGAGQLVAARLSLPDEDEGTIDRNAPSSPHPSARFVLLRHEVYFRRRAGSDRIDYDQEPTRVYSLYMHLGAPDHVDTTAIADANPTWLNRALAMKKEYDLGLAFQAAHPSPAAQWTPHLTKWQRRQPLLDRALTDLGAGRVALFPEGEDAVTVALGDFLGVAGHLAANRFGLHLEVFSKDLLDDPWFERIDQGGNASRPYHDERNLDEVNQFLRDHVPPPLVRETAGITYRLLPPEQKATRHQSVALKKKNEWALDRTDFPGGGWDAVADLMWWPTVVPPMNTALGTNAAAQLPANAVVWHYHPLGLLHWLNDLTWKSEWPKYQVKDEHGAAVAVPARPPRRR